MTAGAGLSDRANTFVALIFLAMGLVVILAISELDRRERRCIAAQQQTQTQTACDATQAKR